MKLIPTYEAPDGSRFISEDACYSYEEQCDRINAVMSKLNPRHNASEFQNGGGFIQQERYLVLTAYNAIMSMAVEFGGVDEKHVKALVGHEFSPFSMVGRILDEGRHCALIVAWNRFMCIDPEWREWGQPFFAMNPNEGKQQPFAN